MVCVLGHCISFLSCTGADGSQTEPGTFPLSQVEALGAVVVSKNSDDYLFSEEAAPWASEAEEGMQFHSYEAHKDRVKECSCHMYTQHQE